MKNSTEIKRKIKLLFQTQLCYYLNVFNWLHCVNVFYRNVVVNQLRISVLEGINLPWPTLKIVFPKFPLFLRFKKKPKIPLSIPFAICH